MISYIFILYISLYLNCYITAQSIFGAFCPAQPSDCSKSSFDSRQFQTFEQYNLFIWISLQEAVQLAEKEVRPQLDKQTKKQTKEQNLLNCWNKCKNIQICVTVFGNCICSSTELNSQQMLISCLHYLSTVVNNADLCDINRGFCMLGDLNYWEQELWTEI